MPAGLAGTFVYMSRHMPALLSALIHRSEAEMPNETQFWTVKGHITESALRVETAWEDSPDCTVCHIRYFDATGELVKNDMHVLARKSLFAAPVADLNGGN